MAHKTRVKNVKKNTTLYAVYQEKKPLLYLHYGDLRPTGYLTGRSGWKSSRAGDKLSVVAEAYQKWEALGGQSATGVPESYLGGGAQSEQTGITRDWDDYRKVYSFEFDLLDWEFDKNKVYYEYLYFLTSEGFNLANGSTYVTTNGNKLGTWTAEYAKPQMLVTKDTSPSKNKTYYIYDASDYIVRTRIDNNSTLNANDLHMNYGSLETLAKSRSSWASTACSYWDGQISQLGDSAISVYKNEINDLLNGHTLINYINEGMAYLNIYLNAISDINDRMVDLSTNTMYIDRTVFDPASVQVNGVTCMYDTDGVVGPDDPHVTANYYWQFARAYGITPVVPFGWVNSIDGSASDTATPMYCAVEWYTDPSFKESSKWDFSNPFVYKDEAVYESTASTKFVSSNDADYYEYDGDIYTFASSDVIRSANPASVKNGFDESKMYVYIDEDGDPILVNFATEPTPVSGRTYWLVDDSVLVKGDGDYLFKLVTIYNFTLADDETPEEGKIYYIQNESENFERDFYVSSTNFADKARYVRDSQNYNNYILATEYTVGQSYYTKEIVVTYTPIVYGNTFTVKQGSNYRDVFEHKPCPGHYTTTLDTTENAWTTYYILNSEGNYVESNFVAGSDTVYYEYDYGDANALYVPTTDATPASNKTYYVRANSDYEVVYVTANVTNGFANNKTYYESAYMKTKDVYPVGEKCYFYKDIYTQEFTKIYFRNPKEYKDGLGTRYHLYAHYIPIAFLDRGLAVVPSSSSLQRHTFYYSDANTSEKLEKIESIGYYSSMYNDNGAIVNSAQGIQFIRNGIISYGTNEVFDTYTDLLEFYNECLSDLSNKTTGLMWKRQEVTNVELEYVYDSMPDWDYYYYDDADNGGDRILKHCTRIDYEKSLTDDASTRMHYVYRAPSHTISSSIGELANNLSDYGYEYTGTFYRMLSQKHIANVSSDIYKFTSDFSTGLVTGYYLPSSYREDLYSTNAYVYSCSAVEGVDVSESSSNSFGYVQGFQFELEPLYNIDIPEIDSELTYNLKDLREPGLYFVGFNNITSTTDIHERVKVPPYNFKFDLTEKATNYILESQQTGHTKMSRGYTPYPSNKYTYGSMKYDNINGAYTDAGTYYYIYGTTDANGNITPAMGSGTLSSSVTYTDEAFHRAMYCLYRTVANGGTINANAYDVLVGQSNANNGVVGTLINKQFIELDHVISEPRILHGYSAYGGTLYSYDGSSTKTFTLKNSYIATVTNSNGNSRSYEVSDSIGTTYDIQYDRTISPSQIIPLNYREYDDAGSLVSYNVYTGPGEVNDYVSYDGSVYKQIVNQGPYYIYYEFKRTDDDTSDSTCILVSHVAANGSSDSTYLNPLYAERETNSNYPRVAYYSDESLYSGSPLVKYYTCSERMKNFMQLSRQTVGYSSLMLTPGRYFQPDWHWGYYAGHTTGNTSWSFSSLFGNASIDTDLYYISNGILHVAAKHDFSDTTWAGYSSALYGTNKALIMDLHMINPFDASASLEKNFGIDNLAVTLRWETVDNDD